MTDAIKEVAVERAGAHATHATLDLLAVEEPLEIRISWDEAGEPRLTTVAVTMRTPASDIALMNGYVCSRMLALRCARSDDSVSSLLRESASI